VALSRASSCYWVFGISSVPLFSARFCSSNVLLFWGVINRRFPEAAPGTSESPGKEGGAAQGEGGIQ
jgi:hypothetical protein